MRARIVNWRCIKEAQLELAPINVFIGKNSTGKSSLVYALYFLAKLPVWRDPEGLLKHLYGAGFDGVVRRESDGPVYPLIVEAGEARFKAKGPGDYELPESAPWEGAYLLPSTRIAMLKMTQALGRLIRESGRGDRVATMFLGVLAEILSHVILAPPMPLFTSDLMRIYTGFEFKGAQEVEGAGRVMVEALSILSLVTMEYEDPYIKGLRIPVDQAPDGIVDSILIREFVDRAPPRSLVVIEEAENQKNPLLILRDIREIAVKSVRRDLTLAMTTHNDLVIHTLLKAVSDGELRPGDIRVYYLERSRADPWTRVRELRVYDDGTIEEIPGAEEVTTALF